MNLMHAPRDRLLRAGLRARARARQIPAAGNTQVRCFTGDNDKGTAWGAPSEDDKFFGGFSAQQPELEALSDFTLALKKLDRAPNLEARWPKFVEEIETWAEEKGKLYNWSDIERAENMLVGAALKLQELQEEQIEKLMDAEERARSLIPPSNYLGGIAKRVHKMRNHKMTWLPIINKEPEDQKEETAWAGGDKATGKSIVAPAAREHTQYTHSDGGYHAPVMSTDSVKGWSVLEGNDVPHEAAAAEQMIALLDKKYGTASHDSNTPDLPMRADIDEQYTEIVQIMHARHSLEVLGEVLYRRKIGRAGVGSMMDEVGHQRTVKGSDATVSLAGAVQASSVRTGPLPGEEGRFKAAWAATRRRFWGAWHALIPFLPYADPVLSPAEQIPPSADMMREFIGSTLTAGGDRRIEHVCKVLDADEDGFLTYNENMQVPELLLLPAQRTAFELYKLHLDLQLPQLAAGDEQLPPSSGIAYIPARVALRRRQRLMKRDLLRAMRKNLQMLRFNHELTPRMRCLYHFADKYERGAEGELKKAKGTGGGETTYEEELEIRKNETTMEVLAGGKSQEVQQDKFISVGEWISRQKVELPDLSRIGYTIGRDYYAVSNCPPPLRLHSHPIAAHSHTIAAHSHRCTHPSHRCTHPSHRCTHPSHRCTLPSHRCTHPSHRCTHPSHRCTHPSHRCTHPSHRCTHPSHRCTFPCCSFRQYRC
jgi:hypothetical protein